jgi:hypothetical protein
MTALRNRVLGETIGNGDFIVAGEQRFTAIEACIVGQVIRTTGRIQVLTYDPLPIDLVALARNLCFPPKQERPPCFECGEPSTHVWEQDYEPRRYLCQPCFREWEHNDERNERALHAD